MPVGNPKKFSIRADAPACPPKESESSTRTERPLGAARLSRPDKLQAEARSRKRRAAEQAPFPLRRPQSPTPSAENQISAGSSGDEASRGRPGRRSGQYLIHRPRLARRAAG